MQLFYSKELVKSDTHYSFPKDESKHIVKVLRRSSGDQLKITNGRGLLFDAIIEQPDPRACVVRITRVQHQEPRPFNLHMAVAPTKMNDRFEWFLEKATELGVEIISPVICDRSERRKLNLDRMEKIILSAMKQSFRTHLPRLNPLLSFKEFISIKQDALSCIAHCESSERKSLKSILRPNIDTTILIGPEGDFTVKEIEMALAQNYIPVTLGKTRLRTETAAIAACHSVAFINE